MDRIASELLVERLADWGVDIVFGLPDDPPLTGGLGLLGTKPSEAVVHECDTLLMSAPTSPTPPTCPSLATMACALPYAIAAQWAHPGRQASPSSATAA
jgi:thiamine pyrophosphate-dependent acetolactate synthase large subunit-like protein